MVQVIVIPNILPSFVSYSYYLVEYKILVQLDSRKNKSTDCCCAGTIFFFQNKLEQHIDDIWHFSCENSNELPSPWDFSWQIICKFFLPQTLFSLTRNNGNRIIKNTTLYFLHIGNVSFSTHVSRSVQCCICSYGLRFPPGSSFTPSSVHEWGLNYKWCACIFKNLP